MGIRTTPTGSDKTLDLLEAIANAPDCSVAACAEACGLPFSTAHRLLQRLVARGFVISLARGRYRLGPAALALAARGTLHDLLRDVGRPFVARLARACQTHAHLAIYEENMVTYLVKQRFGRGRMMTEEGAQLEAYCSSLGKVLLAHVDEESLENYLSQGALVPLTPHTIVDVARLRRELAKVKRRGWAMDLGEIAPDLACLAVPITDAAGRVCAAISVSFTTPTPDRARLVLSLPALLETASAIEEKLFPARRPVRPRS